MIALSFSAIVLTSTFIDSHVQAIVRFLSMQWRRAEHPDTQRESERQHPSQSADAKRTGGARVVERLLDGDNHRHEHPDRRDGEYDRRRPWNEPGDPKDAWRRREADRAKKLPHVRLRAW